MNVLLAPNGKPSKLTPEQYKLVRTPEFKAWFGDWENDPENSSKVIDENGEPLVLNHTTKKYEKFDKIKQETIYGVYEDEFDVDNFMQESGNYIFSTPKSSVNPIFLSRKGVYALADDVWQVKFFANIKNLFDTDNKKDLKKLQDYTIKTYSEFGNFDDMAEDLYGGGYETFEVDYLIGNRKNKYDNNGSIPALISEMGYGGYINKDENVLVVFNKNNLKLADGTNIKFDGNNPDIRFAKGGKVIILPADVQKYKKIGIEDKYFIEASKDVGLQGVNFDSKSLFKKITDEFTSLLNNYTDYLIREDSPSITSYIQNEIATKTELGA
jgi:hypothetical protein